jgi:hypothetical protein
MGLLTQNSKMKKSSLNGITVVNWTLPAFQSSTGLKTCPMAGSCATGCYARSGTYRFSNVAKKHEQNLDISKSSVFAGIMIDEIESWLNKKSVKHLKIRIHDAGDFYSQEYLNKWVEIMNHFIKNSRVSFYAYTKSVTLLKQTLTPPNFRVIFSFGGKEDRFINLKNDFHSRVFESIKSLGEYVDGTSDDLVAAIGTNNKIGLVYHGAKNFENTKWGKVS